jgi:hypothetical protein
MPHLESTVCVTCAFVGASPSVRELDAVGVDCEIEKFYRGTLQQRGFLGRKRKCDDH